LSNHLCKNFIDDVAEGYGSELLGMVSLPLFGDEIEESSIESLKDLSCGVGVFNNFPNLYPDHRPTVMEKITGEAIRARCLALFLVFMLW
jgi:hypothetical protein